MTSAAATVSHGVRVFVRLAGSFSGGIALGLSWLEAVELDTFHHGIR
jgi:hypothetical protein